jgi:methionine--tRNA ligase beta chain
MQEMQPPIDFVTFTRMDLRVATITKAEHHPDADRLLRLQLDDGTEAGRQVCAGIRKWYDDPSSLEGSQVVIVANLEPRVIRGERSEGMVLAGTAADVDGNVEDLSVLRMDHPLPPGSRVS